MTHVTDIESNIYNFCNKMLVPKTIFFKLSMLKIILKLNLWLTAPKGVTPVNQTSATDWQMAAQGDNSACSTYKT